PQRRGRGHAGLLFSPAEPIPRLRGARLELHARNVVGIAAVPGRRATLFAGHRDSHLPPAASVVSRPRPAIREITVTIAAPGPPYEPCPERHPSNLMLVVADSHPKTKTPTCWAGLCIP